MYLKLKRGPGTLPLSCLPCPPFSPSPQALYWHPSFSDVPGPPSASAAGFLSPFLPPLWLSQYTFSSRKKDRGHKEDYRKGEEARRGLCCRIANKIVCSLEGHYGLFQRRVNLDAQKQWAGLIQAKINLSLQSYVPGVWLTTMTCPVRNLYSENPSRFLSTERFFTRSSLFG